MPGVWGTIVKISDVIFNDKNGWEDLITALCLSTLLLRNISAGRGGAHLHSEHSWDRGRKNVVSLRPTGLLHTSYSSLVYTLWCSHEQQNYLTILFFSKVYIATWCTEAHKNKKIIMDRGVKGDSSRGIRWISIQMLCGHDYVNHWTPGVCSTCATVSGEWGRIRHVFFVQL